MSSSPPPDLLSPGTRLARRYIVHEHLGSGGMSEVYRGEHETIGRPVAIKVLARALSNQPSIVVRFLLEAKASSKVRHENVVEVTDFGETDSGSPFIVMEFLEGEDLAITLHREGPFTWERSRTMLLQILAALQASHDQGIIHRDIKPENIFRLSRMGSDDFLKVFDFGIAKVLLGDDGNPAKPLTLEGQIMGTPAYMSPEQCLGEVIDARSDLYAVGCIAYQMLTGRTPFVSDRQATLVYSHVYEAVLPMSDVGERVEIDSGVEEKILRALKKSPEERYGSAREFGDALVQDERGRVANLLPGLRSLLRRKR